MAALRRGAAPETLAEWSGIDPLFLHKLQHHRRLERQLLQAPELDAGACSARQAPRLLRSTRSARCSTSCPSASATVAASWDMRPVYKMVDTCAAEFEAVTPYFYSTYEQENEAPPLAGAKVVVLGSGPIRIGQGIEFDYCSVQAAMALRDAGVQSIMINSNPETVTTDFDASDRLYFEPLDEESVRDVLENETTADGDDAAGASSSSAARPRSTWPSRWSRARRTRCSARTCGAIDLAEDRDRFERSCSTISASRSRPGGIVATLDEALTTGRAARLPGAGAAVVRARRAGDGDRRRTTTSCALRSPRSPRRSRASKPVLVDKYLEGSEVEVDAICDGERRADPRHHGAHRARRRPLGRLHRGLSRRNRSTRPRSTRSSSTRPASGWALGVRGLINIQYVVYRRRRSTCSRSTRAAAAPCRSCTR